MSDWTPPEEFDDYVIERPLGTGAMGRVFLAQDAVLARPVAVKFIASLEPDAASRQRFLLEARATARLQHPNVVAIYRVGELDQKPYIVSEFVRGQTLDQLPVPLPAGRTLDLGIELARGLAAAHRRGVIHGDIKPANAILSEDNIAKLLDFGLATIADTGDAKPKTARAIVGTPDYMAPELWRGVAPDRRSDVYAFGALLYHLAVGHPPFHDVEPRNLAKVVQERAAPATRVGSSEVRGSGDARLAAVIDRCLARAPEERWASGDELREALEQCRSQAAATPVVPGGNPYRGLRPFEADHRLLFFGRSAELGVVIDRLRAEPFVLVAGDSGSGKSSLCRAAVVPAITDGALGDGRTWSAVQVVPGRRPLRALAAALAGAFEMEEDAVLDTLKGDGAQVRGFVREKLGAGRGLVVFVDQLEELVTIAEPGEAAAADRALARIGAGVPGARLLATARADFLGRLAALPDLGEQLTRALSFLRLLGPDEIREVIIGPATATGVRFETDEMIDALVAASAGHEGGLPLLQFALAELWAARDVETNTITAAALASLGGVEGALSRHADAVIAAMTPAQQAAARRALTRLVTAEGTRARRTQAELGSGEAANAALEALVRGRLVIAHEADDGSGYELSHEVLVRGWETLRAWLVEDADARLMQDRVHAAAVEWDRLKRARDGLWRGQQLAEVGRLSEVELTDVDRAFLAASRGAQRRRTIARVAGVAAVPVLVGAVYLGVQAANARALRQKVDGLKAIATKQLVDAHAKLRAADAKRAEAYARFDAPDLSAESPVGKAQEEWRLAVAASEDAKTALAASSRSFEVALAADPDRRDVRKALGHALLERAVRAERDQDPDLDDLVARLPLYDPDGSVMAEWTAASPVELVVAPRDAAVTIRRDGETSIEPLTDGTQLAPGTYVVEASAPGHAPLAHPIVARRGQTTTIDLTLPRADAVPEGFIAIAPGDFVFGTADPEAYDSFFATAPSHVRRTDGFLIGRHEVTFGAWIRYLDALPPAEQELRRPRALGDAGVGAVTLEKIAGAWVLKMTPVGRPLRAMTGEPLRYEARASNIVQSWYEVPVGGIAPDDVSAYAAWLDETGQLVGARLCTELEWERAARGADARRYPHGDRLAVDDANIDVTYAKIPDAMGPDMVGSHPRSRSPFGVDDMAGNVWEWTRSALSLGFAARGGSYYHSARDAQVVNRQLPVAAYRSALVGARICADLPKTNPPIPQ
jgi:formylglycine-generating enzyme required for sulfatase activity